MTRIISSIIVALSIIGGAYIVSTSPFKNNNVIEFIGGKVKLGEVYEEVNLVSMDFVKMEDGKEKRKTLFVDERPENAMEKLRLSLQKMADDDNKITGENLVIGNLVPSENMSIEIISSIRYRSEFKQSSFTLTLKQKVVEIPKGELLYLNLKKHLAEFLKQEEAAYEKASLLK